ncbi:MAG: putative transcriptional regulator [Clostridia bacterium]|jgi:hypothetical protein|nr:putative transcriptional regulator [Clostridia bacterium]
MAVKANNAFSKIVKLGVFDKVPNGAVFTLLHTVANSDDNGIAKMTITRLAEITGRTRKTTGSDIKSLETINYNGEPLLKRVIALVDGKQREIIKVNDIFLTDISIGESKTVNVEVFIEEINQNKLTAKDIAKLFARLYQEEFSISYVINWSRDIAVIKKGLIGKFSDDELAEIIEVSIKDYSKLWAKREYPRPSITMLSNWLAKRAAEVVAQRRKEVATIKQHNVQRDKAQRATSDKLKRLFGE